MENPEQQGHEFVSLNGEVKQEQLCHYGFFMRFEIARLCEILIKSTA